MKEKDLIQINGDIENIHEVEEYDCDCGQEVSSPEEIMGYISVSEEEKRIEIQDNPTSSMPNEYLNDQLVKDMLKKIHIIGEGFQILLGYGIDYNNALAISSNLITNSEDTERAKIQSEVNQQQL